MKLIKTKAVFEILLVVSLSIIFSANFKSVNAQEEGKVCCINSNGQTCQTLDQSESNRCDPGNLRPGGCFTENGEGRFNECRLVCCDLTGQGQDCQRRTTVSQCTSQGGTPLAQADCTGVSQCQPGCCIIGTQAFVTSQQACNSKASELGYPGQPLFDTTAPTDAACFAKVHNLDRGCCAVQNNDQCLLETRDSCQAKNGQFFPNQACTSDVIKSQGLCGICQGETTKKCSETSTNIAEFDSCGNEILGTEIVCDFWGAGQACDDSSGTAECVNLNCATTWDNSKVDYDKVPRQYGESWCEFEANAGPGLDLPGSVHYKHYCEYGKEKAIACTESFARDKFCQDVVANNFRSASCIPNEADKCLNAKDKEQCDTIGPLYCIWTGSEDKGVCIPKIPKSNKFWKEDPTNNIPEDKAKQVLRTYWSGSHELDCDSGCEIFSNKFAAQWNLLCNTYGDYGAKYNVLGNWGEKGFERSCYVAHEDAGDRENPGDIFDSSDNPEKLIDTWWDKDSIEMGQCDADGDDCAYEMVAQCGEKITEGGKIKKYLPDFDQYKNYLNALFLNVDASKYDFWSADNGAAWIVGGLGGGAGAATVALTIIEAAFYAGEAASLFGPVGWIVAVVIIVVAVVIAAITFYSWEETTEDIEFECKPWQPPIGGNDCGKCQEGELIANGIEGHECTEYRCESLGTGCDFVETTEGGKCVNSCIDENGNMDVSTPKISINQTSLNQIKCSATEQPGPDQGCQVTSNDLGFEITSFVKPYQEITLKLETTELAICEYDETKKQAFGDLGGKFDQTQYSQIHTKTLTKSDLGPGKIFQYHVICQDMCGNPQDLTTTRWYEIKFKVANIPDLEPPIAEKITPAHRSFVAATEENKEIEIELNEGLDRDLGAGCKWDIQDKEYVSIVHNFSVVGREEGQNQKVRTLLSLTNDLGENNYYFKCRDNNGNTHVVGSGLQGPGMTNNVYTLIKTVPLKLDSVKCKDPISDSCNGDKYYSEFEIETITSAGAEEGNAKCGLTQSLSLNPDFYFGEDYKNINTQQIGPLNRGSYIWNVICEDKAGNKVNQSINFNILKDELDPIIEKVYTQPVESPTSLVVETDEIAQCKYANDPQKLFTEPQEFETGNGLLHTAPVGDKKRFTILCGDRFNNTFDATNIFLAQKN